MSAYYARREDPIRRSPPPYATRPPPALGLSDRRRSSQLPRCEGLCERISDLNSVFEALTELDFYDYCRKSTQVTAEMPEAEIAGLLQIPPSRPVLKTIVTARSQVGLPLEYSRCWYAADLCSFALGET